MLQTFFIALLLLVDRFDWCQSHELSRNDVRDSSRPNFIFLLLDDQDIKLNSPSYMPNLQSMIVDQGMTFSNAFVATPVCCPSRTESMTGRYFHNIGAPDGDCMHIDVKSNFFNSPQDTLFKLLHNAGYKTGIFGKLTNQDGSYFCDNSNNKYNLTEAGMSRVFSMCNQQLYYDNKYYNKSENTNDFKNISGSFAYFNESSPDTYQTALLGNESLRWIESKLAQNEPFYGYIGVHCPHEPYTPPQWFANEFNNVSLPMTPDVNITFDNNAQNPGQMPWVMSNPPIHNRSLQSMTQIYRDRLRSTLQVDVIIDELDKLLSKYSNGWNNTYLIYSSDHGYHIGNKNLPCEKSFFYDTDIRVPFYVRGPNIAKKSTSSNIVANIDVMPTILDLAGIDIPSIVDGKSFSNSLFSNALTEKHRKNINNNNGKVDDNGWRDVFLIEYMAHANQYFNICGTWYPSATSLDNDVRPNPIDDETGKLIYVDWGLNKNPGNTWRAIRIINETHNWSYVEYVNYTFTYKDKQDPYLRLLYDINSDEYQVTNIYPKVNASIQAELHEMLMTYGNCTGSACP